MTLPYEKDYKKTAQIKALTTFNLKPNFTSNICSQLLYKTAIHWLCLQIVSSSILNPVNTSDHETVLTHSKTS